MKNFETFKRLLVIVLFSSITFYAGLYMGKRGYEFEIRKSPPKITVTNKAPKDQDIDFALFWEVWDMVSKDYLLRPVDAQKMYYGALQGMVSSLGDPYTSYLPPELNETVQGSINGTYEGIGAELGIREDQLVVVAPLDGSPAKDAGLMSGDKITEIEGVSTLGITVTEAVSKIRGQAGTVITMTIQRGDTPSFVVRIKRGTITIESVTWEDKSDGVAYIRISRFGGETNTDWTKTANEINVKMRELNAIILDLRGNPGGYLQGSVHIAGEFYKGKPVLYQESATGEQIPYNADRTGIFQNVPVFVLIDRGSASASEILAAALRENVGAILVGEKSYGKGTIQDSRQFSNGSALHLSVAKWLTPSKEWVHEVGIAPDFIVEMSSEDYQAGNDKQLDKALELAKQI